jgi:hypothetical protein
VISHLDSHVATCLMLTVTQAWIKTAPTHRQHCRLAEGSQYHLDQEPVAKGTQKG